MEGSCSAGCLEGWLLQESLVFTGVCLLISQDAYPPDLKIIPCPQSYQEIVLLISIFSM